MLSDRFMEFQIDGLEETTHRIPEVWTRQGNGNSPVDLLPVGGRELLLDLSCSGLIEGTCCTHHLLVVTRPLETFNPQPARKERAFKSTRGCRSTDGGHAVPATCVPWDAAGAPLTASSAHGFRGPRARPRGEQSHRDGGAFGRRRGDHVNQRDLGDRAGQPHGDRRRAHGWNGMERGRLQRDPIRPRHEDRLLRRPPRRDGRIAPRWPTDPRLTRVEQRCGGFRRSCADPRRLAGCRECRSRLVHSQPLHHRIERVAGLERLPRSSRASAGRTKRDA